ncbi:DEAD/DEAH box helicase [Micrococcales bacterium 31B]|nr:DEAD/DEAH box helicase [Micrococcales bacterium 31B]
MSPRAKRPSGLPFYELPLPGELVDALEQRGLTRAFDIQAAALPDALAGLDVLGQAATGSGKTLAFGLAVLSRLRHRRAHPGRPLAVILTPTRELAMQVSDVLTPLARLVQVRNQLVSGGMNIDKQGTIVGRGVEMVVGTPGRVLELMKLGKMRLMDAEMVVIDEADHMAELGFIDDLRRILDATPKGGQRLLFSATLGGEVSRLADDYLTRPVLHDVTGGQKSAGHITHHILHVSPEDKVEVTAWIANRRGQTMMFARTQLGADRIAEQLQQAGIAASSIHGAKQQGLRNAIIEAFRAGDVRVLVATDVLARGIDLTSVSLVVHVDPPKSSTDYVHRSGRTGRAGAAGTVITLALPHHLDDVRAMVEATGSRAHEIVRDDEDPERTELHEFTGSRRPTYRAVPDPAVAALEVGMGGRSAGRLTQAERRGREQIEARREERERSQVRGLGTLADRASDTDAEASESGRTQRPSRGSRPTPSGGGKPRTTAERIAAAKERDRIRREEREKEESAKRGAPAPLSRLTKVNQKRGRPKRVNPLAKGRRAQRGGSHVESWHRHDQGGKGRGGR